MSFQTTLCIPFWLDSFESQGPGFLLHCTCVYLLPHFIHRVPTVAPNMLPSIPSADSTDICETYTLVLSHQTFTSDL